MPKVTLGITRKFGLGLWDRKTLLGTLIREPFTRSLLLGYEYFKRHSFLSHQHNTAMRVKYFVDLLQV